MLKPFSKKICPFVGVIIGALGCGKKITEAKNPDERIVQNQELPAALVINLDSINGESTIYQIPRNGNILMPDELQVTGDYSPTLIEVIISYNLENETLNYDYECFYKTNIISRRLSLIKCYDSEGEIISQATEFELPIYYTKNIRMKINSLDTNVNVSAIYMVDWK